MKPIFQILCLSLLSCGCAKDRFALIDARTGQEVGQFTYRTGSRVTIDGKTYEIRRLGSAESATEQYVKMTIVPEVMVCNANPYDVVSFLDMCLKDFAPTNGQWTVDRPDIEMQPQTEALPEVTIRGQNLSVAECLDMVATQAHLDVVIEGRHVWLRPKKNAHNQAPEDTTRKLADPQR